MHNVVGIMEHVVFKGILQKLSNIESIKNTKSYNFLENTKKSDSMLNWNWCAKILYIYSSNL